MKPYYEDSYVTIYHADGVQVVSDLPRDSVDVVVTDPPYSSGARQSAQMRSRGSMRREEGKWGKDKWIGSDNLSAHGFAMLVRLFSVECFRVTKVDGHLFSFIDWRQWPVLAGTTESAGWTLRTCLTWDKVHFGMGNGFRQQAEYVLHASKGTADNFLRHDVGTVLRYPREADDLHPTQKPLNIVQTLLSAVPGHIILDPFAGSGTTGVAAKALGRRAILADNDESHCETAAQRCSQETLDLGA
jgi:site-specific DNA-methyltransferase (adenine-specific)